MSPSLLLAARSVEVLCGISLLIQTLEFLFLRAPVSARGIWAPQLVLGDLAHAAGFTQRLFAALYTERLWLAHLILRLIAALALIVFGTSLPLMSFLFVSTVIVLIRWRGAFNGGSDFMTLVVLSGLMIASLGQAFGEAELGWRAGLYYIAIHSASSYFISGAIKLRNADWRSGKALPLFLDESIYGPLGPKSVFWNRSIAIACSWAFILWECLIPIAFLDPVLSLIYCVIAGFFHLLVFWYFGLNRFVFAWISTFPALIYLSGQLSW